MTHPSVVCMNGRRGQASCEVNQRGDPMQDILELRGEEITNSRVREEKQRVW